MAERGGFEPPVEFLTLRRFSKPLLSTTQPPLQAPQGTTWNRSMPRRGRAATLEELLFRALRIFELRGGFFLVGNESITELFGLTADFIFESLFALGIAGTPNAFVILDLLGDYGVKDDRDLVSRGGGGRFGSKLGFHAAQIVAQGRGTAM